MQYLIFIEAAIIGFAAFHLITHDNSSIRRKLPDVKKGPIQIFPTIRLFLNDRTVHFHHWLNFSILLLISIFYIQGGLLDAVFTKGFLVGGIIQGLSMRNTSSPRKLIYKHSEVRQIVKRQSF